MEPTGTQPVSGCLLRLSWLIGGPAALFVLGVIILGHVDRFGGPIDIAFAVVWALGLGARFLDDPNAHPSRSRYCLGMTAAMVAIRFGAHFASAWLR